MKTEKEKQTNKTLQALRDLSALPCFQTPRKGLRTGAHGADRGGGGVPEWAIPSKRRGYSQGFRWAWRGRGCSTHLPRTPVSPHPSAHQQPHPHGSAAPGQPALPGGSSSSSCQPRSQPAPSSPDTPPPRRCPRSRPRPPGSPQRTLASSRCPASPGVATRAGDPLSPAPAAASRCPPAVQVAPHRPVPRVPARRPLAGWAPGEEARESAGPGGAGPPPAAPTGHPRERTGRTGRETPPAAARHRVPAAAAAAGGRRRRRKRPPAPGRSRRSTAPAPALLPAGRAGRAALGRRGEPGAAAAGGGGAPSAPRQAGRARPLPCRAPGAAGEAMAAEGEGPPHAARRPRGGRVARSVWFGFVVFFKLMGHN